MNSHGCCLLQGVLSAGAQGIQFFRCVERRRLSRVRDQKRFRRVLGVFSGACSMEYDTDCLINEQAPLWRLTAVGLLAWVVILITPLVF